MKKRYLLTALLISILFALSGCGGGGSGSSSVPSAVNTGVPSRVQLLDVQNVVQTNSSVFFKAKVLDGNGRPVIEVPVTFTTSFPFGTLQSASVNEGSLEMAASTTVVETDAFGFATARLFSAMTGFATVEAMVDTGSGQIRDARTSYFTSLDLADILPFVILDVDGNANGIFNEPNDFILLQSPADTDVEIRATVLSGVGQVVPLSSVLFSSDSSEATFPLGDTAVTNSSGRASVLMRVDPVTLRDFRTVINVMASADNGGFNMVSLFVEPVQVGTLFVTSSATTLAPGATATITATVFDNVGNPAPDGTSVNFTASSGQIIPFGQTSGGRATSTYTAPDVTANTTVTITASSGGVSDSTTINITPGALSITPSSITVFDVNGGDFVFTVTGGGPPYTVISSNVNEVCNEEGTDPLTCTDPPDSSTWTGTTSPFTFTAHVPPGATQGTYNLSVFDSIGSAPTSATVTVTGIVDIDPPTSTITDPINLQVLTGADDPYTITGNATDNIAVTGVEVSIDGGLWLPAICTGCPGPNVTWDFIWSLPSSDGVLHTIESRATDSSALTGTSPSVTVTVDTIGPLVTGTNPTDNATNVATNATVQITWDENVACGTVTAANITINPVVAGWAQSSCGAATATFTHSGLSAGQTTYTVTVSTSVTDSNGNPMAAPFVFSFETVP